MHGTFILRPLVLQGKSWMCPRAGLNAVEKRGIFPFPENRTLIYTAHRLIALIAVRDSRPLLIHIRSIWWRCQQRQLWMCYIWQVVTSPLEIDLQGGTKKYNRGEGSRSCNGFWQTLLPDATVRLETMRACCSLSTAEILQKCCGYETGNAV